MTRGELGANDRASAALRTVLITGGAGFIGSYLTEQLLDRGWTVRILDDLSTGALDNISHLTGREGLQVHEGSILDREGVYTVADRADVVVHLAAAVGVELVIERPVTTIETNVRGSENVLDAAHSNGSRVILASTSEVYGKGTKFPFAEDDDILLGPTSRSRWGYAASKMVDEFLCFAHHQEHGTAAIPVRLFNTVGARQTGRYGMVVPRLVRQALSGEDLSVYGDGTQRRCFCDVRDVVRALADLIELEDAPVQVYNIGSTVETTITELARQVIAATGSSSSIEYIPYEKAYGPGFEDMQRRVPDTTRIRSLLGWEPKYSLADIVGSVVDYERDRNGDAR